MFYWCDIHLKLMNTMTYNTLRYKLTFKVILENTIHCEK